MGKSILQFKGMEITEVASKILDVRNRTGKYTADTHVHSRGGGLAV